MKTNKGQIIIAVIGAISAVVASVFSAWGMASNRVAAIDTKVQVIEERENNHFAEVQKQMTSMNEKLDKLIDQQITKSNTLKK